MRQLFTKNTYALLLLMFLAVSCSTTKIITIEIPEPAQKELPDRIQSLLLVNRTVDENYSDLKADSLQNIFYRKQFTLDTLIYDLTAVDTTLKALGELLFESGRYDFVIPENRFLDFEKNTFFSQEMPWQQVKDICETYNTDAVLSLDMFSTQVITKYDKDTYFDPIQDGFFTASTANMAIIYNALFRIYDPLEEKVLVREFFKDTVQWSDYGASANDLFRHFTPVKTALTEAGIAIALDFSEKITTVWREEQRSFYVKGDDNLKHAGTFIDNQQWIQAMALWKETAENTKSKATKSKAQLNVAIAYELQGDIENAISWALDSYNTMYRQFTYQYLELLNKRKKELQKQTK
ncbi:DUF6340 family protein [uncultured Draconibacterium sp.]|uniref:DUF6340 family protein n=1 Tax=uncultured Draconibacterium sp. TaxID=1573823 RepID=UPI00321752B3